MAEVCAARECWYRQPVLWLGVLVFTLFVAASAVTIVLAAHHADEPLPVTGEQLLKMPTERSGMLPGRADPGSGA